MIDRGNRSTGRKPAPVPLCPPQIPHAACMRTRAAAVGSQHLTAELRHGPGHEVRRLKEGEPRRWYLTVCLQELNLRRSLLCSTACNVEHGTCNCKLAARIDLRGLRWNASLMRLTFSSEVRVVPGDFTHKQTTCSPQLVVPEPNAFPCRRLTSILRSKPTLNSRKRV
jgi:hypothetical protein